MPVDRTLELTLVHAHPEVADVRLRSPLVSRTLLCAPLMWLTPIDSRWALVTARAVWQRWGEWLADVRARRVCRPRCHSWTRRRVRRDDTPLWGP